jgi:glycosyl hydrolase family 26
MKQLGDRRSRVVVGLALVFVLALQACSWGSESRHPLTARGPVKVLPPKEGVYHTAFPGFGANESEVSADRMRTFERQAGKPIAWAYFSNNWFKGIHFPTEAVNTIAGEGVVPFIRMMARSNWHGYGTDPNYSMQRLISGEYDRDLRAWARDARDSNAPLMVEFGTEVNGNWFPWNGKWNGAGETDGYGNPRLADGPERFRDAFRHIIDLSNEEGANNITWVFHVDAEPSPYADWNTMGAYYPGDKYIDWLGLSVYGPQKPGEQWRSFTPIMDKGYAKLAKVAADKPIALLEFGAVQEKDNERKAEWIHDALHSIESDRYPRLAAVSYWDSRWKNGDGSVSDMRIDSSDETQETYRRDISSSFFTGSPRFSTN